MNRFTLISLTFWFSIICNGQDITTTINDAIDNENYTVAIPLLEGLIQEGNESSDLYSQLGYAFYQQGSLARSMLNYERALKLAPRNKRILESIDLIRSQLPVRITNIPDFILVRWYERIANLMTSTMWSLVQLLSLVTLILLLYFWLFRQRVDPWPPKRWVVIGFTLVFSLFLILITAEKRDIENNLSYAISMNDQVLFQAPDERSEEVVSIGPGNKVYILDQIKEWYKVQLADKDIGWCKKENLEII